MDKISPTILEVVELIKRRVPALDAGTVDTFKSGDPSEPVRGIVVTFMATWKVLEQAVALGANFVITHEPTYYNGSDETEWLEGDALYARKKAFIEKHGITIWRFHDGWHRHAPDGILVGMAKKLGWEVDPGSRTPNSFAIKPQSAKTLAQWCKERLGIEKVRVAGDLEATCTSVGMMPGAWGGRRQIEFLQKHDVDVLICGESAEWETCEYVRDSTDSGKSKALIILGHANSEEGGMEWFGEWLRPLVPANIPIHHLPAGDPFSHV